MGDLNTDTGDGSFIRLSRLSFMVIYKISKKILVE